MIRKKICMLGAVGVGKTSLVRQFVDSMFSDVYQSTVGVRVDKKQVQLDEHGMILLLWDLYGETDRVPVLNSYLQGMDGYLLVVDATRPETFLEAERVRVRVDDTLGPKPCALVLNKSDLVGDWTAVELATQGLQQSATFTTRTSARTGNAVEECFTSMARRLSPSPVDH